MEFQIRINQGYLQEFLRIIDSMKSKGIVSSFQESFVEGDDIPKDMEELMKVMEESEEDIKAGRVHTLEEVAKELQLTQPI